MTADSPTARTYRQWQGRQALKGWLREGARAAAIYGLSLSARIDTHGNWVRFPYYHHVFDDERTGFARQLNYFRNHGDFVSLDQAVEILGRARGVDGRYFCITFDDGFRNCLTNAVPILAEQGCPAAFYVPTAVIGESSETASRMMKGREGMSYGGAQAPVEYLNWEDCQAMVRAGMTIGSHTHTHVCLAATDDAAAESELKVSKACIEKKLGTECRHFAAPWGRSNRDFNAGHERLAERLGYGSFATTDRGANRTAEDRYHLRRDHILANWGKYQLRYFLSRA